MSQLLDSLAVEGAATVFGHKDQMDVHSKNAMSTVPKVVDVHHRPEYRKAMLRLQAYKFELMPNGEQVRMMRRFAGSCRFVYNKGLALNKERYEKKEKRLGYAGLCALLPAWKIEHPFLSDVPAQALQQALKNLERAYINFFKKRADFPKFHKKGQRNPPRVSTRKRGTSRNPLPSGRGGCQGVLISLRPPISREDEYSDVDFAPSYAVDYIDACARKSAIGRFFRALSP